MNYRAEINVMPLEALLDPQGKAVVKSVENLGLPEIKDVRIGKHITLHLEANDEETAKEKVETACSKLLANPIMEYYEYELYSE